MIDGRAGVLILAPGNIAHGSYVQGNSNNTSEGKELSGYGRAGEERVSMFGNESRIYRVLQIPGVI